MALGMTVPTFGGSAVFGLVLETETEAAPKDYAIVAYPGVDGLQLIDGGARGGMTRISGILWGTDAPTLATAIGTLRALQLAGTTAVFVDQYGVPWSNVLVRHFAPRGRTMPAPGYGLMRQYTVELLHLS